MAGDIDFASEFYGLPEFFVQRVATETAAEGFIRVYNWSKRGSIFVPLFTSVVAASDLFVAGKDVTGHALQMLASGSYH